MAERANTEGLLSENNYRLLDEIRRQRTSDKTKLASASGFSWPTVNKLCEELKNSGLAEDEQEAVRELRIEKALDVANTWWEYGEYITVEFDTEARTARVVPVDEK